MQQHLNDKVDLDLEEITDGFHLGNLYLTFVGVYFCLGQT